MGLGSNTSFHPPDFNDFYPNAFIYNNLRHFRPVLYGKFEIMRNSFIFVVIATISPVAFAAGDDLPVLVYPSALAQLPPEVDGLLDDACWTDAPAASSFTVYRKPGRLAEAQTSFRVVYDRNNIYFGVSCDEPFAEGLGPRSVPHDSYDIFSQDGIEIFIDPEHAHSVYYQFASNLAGSIFDARKSQRTWDSRVRVGTRVGKDNWTVEMAIPWSDMGVKRPVSGMVVGFNVCRNRFRDGRKLSYWSHAPGFHYPGHFAHLVLSSTEKMLRDMEGDFRKGGRKGPIRIFNKLGYSNQTYVELARKALGDLDQLIGELRSAARSEKSERTKTEIEKYLVAIEKAILPHRDRLAGERPLDAARWARLDVTLRQVVARIPTLLWDARLASLLAEI